MQKFNKLNQDAILHCHVTSSHGVASLAVEGSNYLVLLAQDSVCTESSV